MKYLLILAAAPDAWAVDTAGDTAGDTRTDTAIDATIGTTIGTTIEDGAPGGDGVFDDWTRYTRALEAAGVLRAGHGLHGIDTATTVRVRDGRRTVTDGPFTESKEHLIGYYVIETDDLDDAIRWAARAPNARIGSVEIRPLLPGSATEDVLAGVVSDVDDDGRAGAEQDA